MVAAYFGKTEFEDAMSGMAIPMRDTNNITFINSYDAQVSF